MGGLKAKDGFVGSGKGKAQKHKSSRIFLVSMIVALLLSNVFLMVFFFPTPSDNLKEDGENGYRAVEQDFGAGYKNPKVAYGNDSFAIATYNHNLNVTLVDTSGNKLNTLHITDDIKTNMASQIEYDSYNKVFLVVWANYATKYINGTIFDSNGKVLLSNKPLVTPSDGTIGNTYFGLAYDTANHKFLLVWSDSSYHNHGRLITYQGGSITLGNIFDISSDTASHARNAVAYDETTGYYLVVWRNNSGGYHITGRIFDGNGNPITTDFTIAANSNDGYDYPNVAGGGGKFFVTYLNNTYYQYGVIVNASTGDIETTIDIASTYYNYIGGVAYNGSAFIVATGVSGDIIARLFDLTGNKLIEKQITTSSDKEETPDVAVDTEGNIYYFVWYDYTDKHVHGSLWTSSEIPEFSALLPILAILLVAIVVWRRRH